MTNRMSNAERDAGRRLVALGTRLLALGLFIVLVQLLLWAGARQWVPCSIEQLMQWSGAETPVDALGVNPVVSWLLQAPLSAVLAAVGLAVAWTGATKIEAETTALGRGN